MQRQRDGLVPIGDALSGMGGPVKAIQPLAPGAAPFHPCRSGEPACQRQRSGRRSRLHGANDGALLVAPHQPRQPNSVHPSERPLHALHDGGRREQTPLRQSTPPLAGVAFDRSGADPKPCADPGFFAFRVHAKARHGGMTAEARAGIGPGCVTRCGGSLTLMSSWSMRTSTGRLA